MAENDPERIENGGTEQRERLSTTVTSATKTALKQFNGSMGTAIDDLVSAGQRRVSYHYVNTNAQHLSGDGSRIFRHGVVATYGGEKFEKKLTDIDPGDGIVSYVSKGHVSYGGGAKAFGIALAPYDGNPVVGDDRLYPDEGHEREYHVPVRWLAVLQNHRTVTPDEKRRLIGEQPSGTKVKVRDDDLRVGTRLLAEVILGRAGVPLAE